MGYDKCLQVPERIPSCTEYVFLNIHPESQNHIYNNRGAHSQKRNIDKPHPDPAGCNTDFIADSGTNSKSTPFYKFLETIHKANLKNFRQHLESK